MSLNACSRLCATGFDHVDPLEAILILVSNMIQMALKCWNKLLVAVEIFAHWSDSNRCPLVNQLISGRYSSFLRCINASFGQISMTTVWEVWECSRGNQQVLMRIGPLSRLLLLGRFRHLLSWAVRFFKSQQPVLDWHFTFVTGQRTAGGDFWNVIVQFRFIKEAWLQLWKRTGSLKAFKMTVTENIHFLWELEAS